MKSKFPLKTLLGRCYRPGKRAKHRPLSLQIYRYAEWRCEKCGTEQNLTRDHIVPRSMGGSNKHYNLQILCKNCNEEKGATIELFTQRKKARRYVREFEKA